MFGASLALAALVVLWYKTILFIVALVRRDASSADTGWGPGFLLATIAVLWWWSPSGARPLLVTLLVAVWAIRLGTHIFLRNWGRGEDWRHAKRRHAWGAWWALRSYLQVFIFQGALVLIIALPVLWVNTFGGGFLTALDWLGVAVWVFGFTYEVIADAQLARFLKQPANHGKVLQTGLWRYSRHPNYFGEAAQWWGLWLIALSVPGGWFTVLGPLAITFLLLRVSGVPLLEGRQMQNPHFRDYASGTPAFIPSWIKK